MFNCTLDTKYESFNFVLVSTVPNACGEDFERRGFGDEKITIRHGFDLFGLQGRIQFDGKVWIESDIVEFIGQ